MQIAKVYRSEQLSHLDTACNSAHTGDCFASLCVQMPNSKVLAFIRRHYSTKAADDGATSLKSRETVHANMTGCCTRGQRQRKTCGNHPLDATLTSSNTAATLRNQAETVAKNSSGTYLLNSFLQRNELNYQATTVESWLHTDQLNH